MVKLKSPLPTKDELMSMQKIFKDYFVSESLKKKRKYETRMETVFSSCDNSDCSVDFLALGQSRREVTLAALKKFRFSNFQRHLPQIFRYVYDIVNCYKAAIILHKLEGIEESEIENILYEVAKELSIAYEYQICMLAHSTDILHLAKYAVVCMIYYLKNKDSIFSYSDIIKGIVDHTTCFKEQDLDVSTRMISSGITVKWKISDIFLLPGLRVPVQDTRPPENLTGSSEVDPLLPYYKLSVKDAQRYHSLISYHFPCGPTNKELKKSKKSKNTSKEDFPVKEIVIVEDQGSPGATEVGEEVNMINVTFRYFCCFSPYGCACDFQLYGYRAPIHVWNSAENRYDMISRDSITTQHPDKCEIPLDVGLHQSYMPKSGCQHLLQLPNSTV
ncbi:hypothetical protein LOTGIDRAFT_235959 [Lottia gigantea]|uniref:Uncharacterized protein n=1 Tax=Lottia gigantea TaxID=225164 RepID=V3ZRB4_LOTGI|nr:hypothetical protein LOTGIDRAFT_235959 [Lottia gigantea]ESO85100.1 hypothetical protein LOTGIDRAFT_235959 [Lottia gigantea]